MSQDPQRKKKKKKKNKKNQQMKHKIISFVIAIAIIVVVIVCAFGRSIKESIEYGDEINARWFLAVLYPDKYGYSRELADMNQYFGLTTTSDVAIVLGDEHLEDKGMLIDGQVYFTLNTAERLFTDRFYYNEDEAVLLYSTSTDIYRVDIGGNAGYTYGGTFSSTEYVPARLVGDTLYVALDYVKRFSNFEYHYYDNPNRVQVYTSWEARTVADITGRTSIRYQGGIKSDILKQVEKGERVYVLETMETWTKVRTEDGITGYVENTKLSETRQEAGTPVTDAYDPWADYGITNADHTIKLAWHQIYFSDDGENLNSLLDGDEGVNVVSPTWFYINNSYGDFDNYATTAYVNNAHNRGYQVWALVEDMTNSFDEYALFSSSTNRARFIQNLISATLEVGADGINIDCECVGKDTGPHFVQFLRELSIETRKNGLILSVDNYVQNQGNLYYDLTEQGIVCDYVIIMGYDEHWAGSEPGSVASIDFVEHGITAALDEGVPASELINGLPFYTRLYRSEGDDISSSAIGMTEAQNWMSTRNITPEWSDECCQYVVNFQDGTALCQMWVEDRESLGAKLGVMVNYNLAGVAGWKLGLENDTAWEVINQYYQ